MILRWRRAGPYKLSTKGNQTCVLRGAQAPVGLPRLQLTEEFLGWVELGKGLGRTPGFRADAGSPLLTAPRAPPARVGAVSSLRELCGCGRDAGTFSLSPKYCSGGRAHAAGEGVHVLSFCTHAVRSGSEASVRPVRCMVTRVQGHRNCCVEALGSLTHPPVLRVGEGDPETHPDAWNRGLSSTFSSAWV